jgi:uncharacterized membrane protein YhaH (DUF805 family)
MNVARTLFTFRGRFGIPEYAVVLGASVVAVVLIIVAGRAVSPFISLALVPVAWVMIAALVKRFHDFGWSGAGCFLVVVPFVGLGLFLLVLAVAGDKGENKYGPERVHFATPGVIRIFVNMGLAIVVLGAIALVFKFSR